MKTCFKCSKTLPLVEFYPHKYMADGHLNKCKECTKQYEKDRRASKPARLMEYEKSRSNLPHRVEARNRYAKTPEGRLARDRAVKAQNRRRPIQRAARIQVGNALRSGKLVKQPCEVCGEIKVHGHHDDYSKPLDVRWLCTTHHAAWHRANTPLCPPQETTA